jgi:ATP-dependent helicase HrpA
VQDTEKDKDRDLMTAITDAVDDLCRLGSGDVLIFCRANAKSATQRKLYANTIRRMWKFCRCLRVYRRKSRSGFQTIECARIVLATNVAETSLTVPGIRLWWIPVWRGQALQLPQ